MSTDAIRVGYMPPALDSAPQPQDDRQKALREKGANTALNFLRVPTMIGRASDLTQEVGTHNPSDASSSPSSNASSSNSATDASVASADSLADAPDSSSAVDTFQARNKLKTVRNFIFPVYEQNQANEKRNDDIDAIIRDLGVRIENGECVSRINFDAVPGLEEEFDTHYDNSDNPAPNKTNDPVNALRRCKRTNEFNLTANVGRLFRSLTEYAAKDISETTESLKASGCAYESKFGIITERNFDTMKGALGTISKYVKNIFNRFAFTKFTDSRLTKYFDQIMNEGDRFVITKGLASLASIICGLANLTFAGCRILLSAIVVTPSVMVLHLAGGIIGGAFYAAYKTACKIYELCGGYNSNFLHLALAYALRDPNHREKQAIDKLSGMLLNGTNITKAQLDETRNFLSKLEESKRDSEAEKALERNQSVVKGALVNLEAVPESP